MFSVQSWSWPGCESANINSQLKWVQKRTKAGTFTEELWDSYAGLCTKLLPLTGKAGREFKNYERSKWKKQQSICCQMSAAIVFICIRKLMAEENFVFPPAAKHHWKLSYPSSLHSVTTGLLPEFQYSLEHWSSPDLSRFDSRSPCSVSNPQLSVIKI